MPITMLAFASDAELEEDDDEKSDDDEPLAVVLPSPVNKKVHLFSIGLFESRLFIEFMPF